MNTEKFYLCFLNRTFLTEDEYNRKVEEEIKHAYTEEGFNAWIDTEFEGSASKIYRMNRHEKDHLREEYEAQIEERVCEEMELIYVPWRLSRVGDE